MNAIHQRPREPWTIESLAREVSVSRATLARRFAHLVGETPPEYLTRWRMDLAAQRLRDSDDTVAAIAAAVGYRSEYSFSRAFTRHRGLAPGRYRRHVRARELAAA
jgi:transcriptional regulator GlxA family with amidase domain